MNILETIVAQKRVELECLPRQEVTTDLLREAIRKRGGVRDFFAALERPQRGGMGLIAEVKKASPSAGVICPDFDAVRIARAYEAAGAACLSVLTDERFFQGSLEYLRAIRAAVSLPLLRKDFIIDERQILEAVEWGADAILLIVAILTDEQTGHLLRLAEGAGLGVLVEAHDQEEMDRALRAGARLVGVNNRDLKTFRVDLATTEGIATVLRERGDLRGRLLVAESGIRSAQDVERLKASGARAILVGESLMREGVDLAKKISELLGGE